MSGQTDRLPADKPTDRMIPILCLWEYNKLYECAGTP